MKSTGLIVVFGLAATLSAPPLPGQSTTPRQTHLAPPRTKVSDPIARLRLAQEIPSPPETYNYVTSIKHAPEQEGKTEVVAYGFDMLGNRSTIGTMALGAEVQLEAFKRLGQTLYYRVPFASIQPTTSPQGIPPKWSWISGRNIEAVAK